MTENKEKGKIKSEILAENEAEGYTLWRHTNCQTNKYWYTISIGHRDQERKFINLRNRGE